MQYASKMFWNVSKIKVIVSKFVSKTEAKHKQKLSKMSKMQVWINWKLSKLRNLSNM